MRPGHVVALLTVVGITPAAAAPPVRFNRDVRPILADACFKCHGPDNVARQAELRLDTREGLLAEREGKPLIAPQRPDASTLWQRITHTDPDERMPPVDSGKSLTPAQIATLKEWIAQGAPWEDHWAFVPPQRPAVPQVRQNDWPRGEIDCFVRSALEHRAEQDPLTLTLSPADGGEGTGYEAAPETLIRRLTLDLTGLPPNLEEVEAYLADSSPDRYERLVDRLLASPRYGEHVAVDWLDAARYADSSGYQNDGPREMWRWRDWVIAAMNANMPFDQFTVEQLAGDLLVPDEAAQVVRQPRGYLPRDPRALDLLIATGFQRNHRGNSEGGIIPEEYAVEYAADRVDTTGAVWLGLTIGCARCHSHKYDPITQKDYYRLFAYFNQVPEYGRAVKEGNSPPYIKAPTPEQRQRLQLLETERAAAQGQWDRSLPQLEKVQRKWERRLASQPAVDVTVTSDLVARLSLDGVLGDSIRPEFLVNVENGPVRFVDGPDAGALDLNGEQFLDAGDVAKFSYFDAFSASAWINPAAPLTGGIVSRTSDDAYEDGWTFQMVDGRLQVNLVKRWLDDAIRVETTAALTPERWQHVAMTYDGSRVADGIKVYVNGVPQPLTVHYDFLNQSFTNNEPLRIGSTGTRRRLTGALADVRIYTSALSAADIGLLATRETVTQIASIKPSQRTAAQAHKLREYFLLHAAPAELREAAVRMRRAVAEHQRFLDRLPTAMVMVDQPSPRATTVLQRGVYDRPGELVTANVPAALNASVPQPSTLSPQPSSNRLDLARWLVDPQHPLTARVAVNRLWQRLFGTGLVKTSEDFGTQGDPPSHPQLLDWLAIELIDSGWDLKHIHRLIVTSATYRQSSRCTPELAQADPENRWLARGPRLRLSAEMLRDQALAASGLLEERLGGPSIYPYQPEGLWQEIATDTQYDSSPAPDVYRRSLYCYTKRTVANPTLVLFDASTRESCTLRRGRTNTPLQALALWNDITFVEAARMLAERSHSSPSATPEKSIRRIFQQVAARPPKADELSRLMQSWSAYRDEFRRDAKARENLLAAGKAQAATVEDEAGAAALVAIASVLLNLDEVVTKE